MRADSTSGGELLRPGEVDRGIEADRFGPGMRCALMLQGQLTTAAACPGTQNYCSQLLNQD